MDVPKSIAIVGEGETEWFYFDSLRVSCHYPFKMEPSMPKHTDIANMAKKAEQLVCQKGYDYVICLVDMDRLQHNRKEMAVYKQLKNTYGEKIIWIDTYPCTEFWFLLHFIPELPIRHYQTCDEVIRELQRYMPGYEKTRKYLQRIKIYEYLKDHGNIDLAMTHADQLDRLNAESPENMIGFSQMHRVLKLLREWGSSKEEENVLKNENQKRIGEVETKILEFLANSSDSDAKSISKSIGLKPSRTNDYLKRLVDLGLIISIGGWKKLYTLRHRLDTSTLSLPDLLGLR